MILKTINIALFRKASQILNWKLFGTGSGHFSTDKIIKQSSVINSIPNHSKQLNSIMPQPQQGYAYGHYFPHDWSEDYIRKTLDPSLKDIQKVSIVKTNVGQHSGKVLIKFKNQKIRKKYIDKYNQDYILTDVQSHRVVILPFQLRTQHEKKQARKQLNFKNPVRISNLDFDITEQQIRKLAADYGQISHIQMYKRQKGINRGFATVFFANRVQAKQFTNFIDGFQYRYRKLKAHIIERPIKKQEKQFLKVPTTTFKANVQLMKRIKSKQYEQVEQQ